MRLPSGMIAFHVPRAEKFGEGLADSLSIFHFAASLGHSHSLILYCDTEALQRTTFRLDDEHLQRYVEFAGSGFFRLSIGLEDPRDLCRDLERALTGVAPAATRAPRAAAR